jgi:hypothetical protein
MTQILILILLVLGVFVLLHFMLYVPKRAEDSTNDNWPSYYT